MVIVGTLVLLGIGVACALADVASDELVLPRVEERPAQPWAFYIWLAALLVWAFA